MEKHAEQLNDWLKQSVHVGMIFPVCDVKNQFVYCGNNRHQTDNHAVCYRTGEGQEVRKQKNSCAVYFVETGVNRRKTPEFHSNRDIRCNTQKQDSADYIPNPGGEQLPQSGQQFDNGRGGGNNMMPPSGNQQPGGQQNQQPDGQQNQQNDDQQNQQSEKQDSSSQEKA